MTSHARVISVNPASVPAGASRLNRIASAASIKHLAAAAGSLQNSVLPRKTFRYPTIDDEADVSVLRTWMKILLGISGYASGLTAPADSVTLTVRAIFGFFLAGCAALTFGTSGSLMFLCPGLMLIAGLLTRLSGLTIMTLEGISGYLAFKSGDPYYINVVLGAGGLIVAVLGPGHLSLDSLLERKILRGTLRSRQRKARARRSSYRSYLHA